MFARACFARGDFREDSQYFLIVAVTSAEHEGTTIDLYNFDPAGASLVHDSVFTTLTAEAFAAESLRRQRFPRRAEIIVRLHGLVSAAHLNGREGALRGRDPNNAERFAVRLDSKDGKEISVRSQNYETVQRPKLLVEEF
jgi:hypothetical protein